MGGPRQERRVALVLGTSAGGVGRHVRMLADGLTRRGLRVVVAGPAATRDAFGFPDARFVPVGISDRPHPLRDARAVMTLRRLAREADVLHAHRLRASALAGLAGLSPVRVRARRVVTRLTASTAAGAGGG